MIVGTERVEDFAGPYKGSSKEADQLFLYQEPNLDQKCTAVVEIGFSETYDQLVEDAKQWIEGITDIRIVFLVKVEEKSPYKSPIRDLENDEELEDRRFPNFEDVRASMIVPETSNRSFGPLQINGLVWVDEMKMFLETWKRGSSSAKAEQHGLRQVSRLRSFLLLFRCDVR